MDPRQSGPRQGDRSRQGGRRQGSDTGVQRRAVGQGDRLQRPGGPSRPRRGARADRAALKAEAAQEIIPPERSAPSALAATIWQAVEELKPDTPRERIRDIISGVAGASCLSPPDRVLAMARIKE